MRTSGARRRRPIYSRTNETEHGRLFHAGRRCVLYAAVGSLQKKNENGRVIRYKARLVAKGFKQKFGIDFFETYSPVANVNSVRVVLAVRVAVGYVIKQLDAEHAFLKSVLKDRNYMEIPCALREQATSFVF